MTPERSNSLEPTERNEDNLDGQNRNNLDDQHWFSDESEGIICLCSSVSTYVHVLHDIYKYDVCLYLVVDRFLHMCVYNWLDIFQFSYVKYYHICVVVILL